MKKKIFILLIILLGAFGTYIYKPGIFQPKASQDLSTHNTPSRHSLDEQLFKKWKKYDANPCFSAFFPNNPKTIERPLPIPGSKNTLPYTECIHVDSDTHTSISVSYTIIPKSWLSYGNSLVLSGALKVLLKDKDDSGHLVGKEKTTFKTFPALDYQHYNTTHETAGTLILIDQCLYKVEVSYSLETKEESQLIVDFFINHFSPISSTQSEHLITDIPQSPTETK